MKSITEKKDLIAERNLLAYLCRYTGYLLHVAVYLYLVAIACILPFYFVIETGYREIGSNKSAFFRKWGFAIAVLLAILFCIYMIFSFMYWLKRNWKTKNKFTELCNLVLDTFSTTDRFVIILAFTLCLSYYYSNYPESAYWGAPGWNMGFMTQMILIESYFVISRLIHRREIKWIVMVLLTVSFVVFALGVLNRYGINPLGMESCGPEFISTIGNINWYCGYWSVLFPIGASAYVFYPDKNIPVKVGLGIYVAVGYATGITQGSDSGILVIAGLILILGLLCKKEEYKIRNYLQMLLTFCSTSVILHFIQKWWPERNRYVTQGYSLFTGMMLPFMVGLLVVGFYLLFTRKTLTSVFSRLFQRIWIAIVIMTLLSLVGFVVLLCINSIYPGSIGPLSENSLFTFNAKWASSRGATWTAGMKTWWSNDILHKVLGVGPDSMAGYIYNGPDITLLEEVTAEFGFSRLTNAHGEWITVLANLGILGLIGFGGMILSGILRYIKEPDCNRLCIVFGISILCYTLHNVFSFQQTMNVTQMFIVLGLGEALKRQNLSENRISE